MLGGAFLCFEGVEKVLHSLEARKHKEDPERRQQRLAALAERDPLAFERDKVKGAIRTDFILSAEIVAITLGIVAEAPLLNQILILSGIAILVTIGVYGLVGVIVKLDDMGYWLAEKRSALAQWLGKGLGRRSPPDEGVVYRRDAGHVPRRRGIVVHGIAPLHHAIEHWSAGLGGVMASTLPVVANLVLGFIIGAVVLAGVKAVSSLRGAGK